MPTPLRRELPPCALLVAFWLFLFRGVLLGDHFLFGNDFNAFYMGMRQFLFTGIHEHGSIPYWNPYIFGGIPFWGHFESSIFYPLGFLFWILPASKAYGYTVFLHLVLAALFMYGLARHFGIGRPGAFLAGAVFSCNGFVMALLYLGHLGPVQSYPWLPLVILLLHRGLKSESPFRSVAAAGFFWGVQILAGAPQDAFYTYLTALFLGIISFGSTRSPFLRPLACLLLLFLVGVCVSAIQVIPGMELIQESVRVAQASYENATSRSLPPEGIVSIFLPHFFWDPATNSSWIENMPYSMPMENLYVGILPFFLFLVAPARRAADGRLTFFVVGLALFGVLLAMGHHTPVYKLFYLFPGFDKFRSPTRVMVLWVFAASLLAGKGMDLLSSKAPSKGVMGLSLGLFILFIAADILIHMEESFALRIFSFLILEEGIPEKMVEAQGMIRVEFHRFTLLFGAILFLWLLMQRKLLHPKVGPWLLCALLLIDLQLANGRYVQFDDRFSRNTTEAKRFLDQSIGNDHTPFRVGSFAFSHGPNFEMALGHQTVGGFTALFPERYYEYINAYSEDTLPEGWQYYFYGRHQRKVLMDLLNVKYEIHYPTRQVFQRESYLPRALVVPDSVIKKRGEVLDFLVSAEFDPTKIVVIEEGERRGSQAGIRGPTPIAAKTEVISYRPDAIRVGVDSPSSGYLFLSENFYPGWEAFVDGVSTRVFRGNYLFRVIEIPAGEHVVEFIFRPLSIRIGTGVTILTLFGLLLTGILCRHRRRAGFHGLVLE